VILPRIFSFSLLASLNGRFIPQENENFIELQRGVVPASQDDTKVTRGSEFYSKSVSFNVQDINEVDDTKLYSKQFGGSGTLAPIRRAPDIGAAY